MAEALPFADMHPWTRTLPNGTTVSCEEFRWTAAEGEGPQAFLVHQPAGSVVEPHFHVEDEFQVVVGGGGRLGRHGVTPFSIHYSGAYTPYGPIVAGADGIRYFTLRARRDPGARFLPAARDEMKPVPKRFYMADVSEACAAFAEGVDVRHLIPETPERIACLAVDLAPGAEMVLPDATGTGGQYVLMTTGEAAMLDRQVGRFGAAFVRPGETGLAVRAGGNGAALLLLQFPEAPVETDLVAAPGASRWECPLCGFVYDEAEGLELDGIAAGTRFEDLDPDWSCPNCDAAKAEFERLG